MTQNNNNQKGFTLIEMMVALTIFVVTILVATNVYLLVSDTQQRTLAAQKIMDDVRALFDTIVQEARLGTINYNYYTNNTIDLHPDAGVPVEVLAIRSQGGQNIFFRKDSTRAQFCDEIVVGDCDPTSSEWIDITPAGVEVQELQFIITPSADPFVDVDPVDCSISGNDDCNLASLDSYRCAGDNFCRYYSDGNNFQPKVTILIKSKSIASKLIKQSQITMQTTVASRVISGQVLNLNY